MANGDERLKTSDKVFSTFLLIVGFVLLAATGVTTKHNAQVMLFVVGAVVILTGLLTMTRPRKD